jgi:hypothetical protein
MTAKPMKNILPDKRKIANLLGFSMRDSEYLSKAALCGRLFLILFLSRIEKTISEEENSAMNKINNMNKASVSSKFKSKKP